MNLRVLHICARFSAPSETFIYAALRAQQRAGVQVEVATFDRVEAAERPFDHVHVLPLRPSWHPARVAGRLAVSLGLRHRLTYTWPDLRSKLQALIQRVSPDIIHAHFGPMGVFATPVAERVNLPLLTSFYGYDASERPNEPYWRARYDELWNRGHVFQALSVGMKDRLLDLGAPESRIHVIHLARDLDSYPYVAPEPPVQRFICVARMTEKKGHFDLLEAFQRVRAQRNDVHLTLVGDGPLRGAIEAVVDEYGLRDAVDITGWQTSEQVRKHLIAADAFILCSKTARGGDREGTPTVLVEAQAVGLPVIATNHAGIPEMIPEENHHLLAPEGNPAEIASRIQGLLEFPPSEVKAISRAGRQKIEQSFNLTRETERLIELYQALRNSDA